MLEQLADLVQRCTVRLEISDGSWGTGFFVAPNFILTCAHVVEPANGDPKLVTAKSLKLGLEYKITHIELRGPPYPDLALLSIDRGERIDRCNHPCVLLYSDVRTGHKLRAYGYTEDWPNGDTAIVTYDGVVQYNDRQWLLKLSEGQIIPGFSGSALVDLNTGGVCGVVNKTRDRQTDLGGIGIPTEVVLEAFPQLKELQEEFHSKDSHWTEASGKEFGWGGWTRVNAKPKDVSRWFKNREDELAEFREALKDPDNKMICIVGDPGMGKTDILCKVCDDIEHRQLKLPQQTEQKGTNGIIYYNCRFEALGIERLLGDFETLLGGQQAERISQYKGNPELSVEEKTIRMLNELELTKGAYLIVLDNFEKYLTEEHTIKDAGFKVFIDTCLSAGKLRVLASSRQDFLPENGDTVCNIELDKGLPNDKAIELLRDLDKTGKLEEEKIPKKLLDRAVTECSGIPRALELVTSYLNRNKTKPLTALLDNKELFGEAVVENLTRLQFSQFDLDERRVVQALAIYGRPVPEPAVSFLLKPFSREINVTDVLADLVGERSVYFLEEGKLYHLHPMNQKYADLKIPETGKVCNRKACHAQAGKYWFAEAKGLEDEYASKDTKEPYEFTDFNIRKQWVENVERGFRHLIEAEAWDPFIANNKRILRALAHKDGWGYIQQTTETCEKVNELLPKINNDEVSAKWLAWYTVFNIHLGNFERAEDICKDGLSLSQRTGQKAVEGEFLWRMATICWGLGRIDEARECIERSAQLKREAEGEFAQSRACGFWSELDEMEGQLEVARKKQEFALRLGRPESKYHVAQNDGRLLRTHRLLGDYESALKSRDEGLECARRNDYTRLLILILCEAGDLSIDLKRCDEASEFLFESHSTADDRGYKFETALSGYALGRFYHQQGRINDAREKYEKALSLGMTLSSYKCAVMLGLLSLEEGRSDKAEEYFTQGIDHCNKLLENKTKMYDPMYYRALAQLALGKKEESLTSYKDSLGVCSAAGVLKEKLLDLSLLEKARKDVAGLNEAKKLLRAAS